jgi:hypothetical protein
VSFSFFFVFFFLGLLLLLLLESTYLFPATRSQEALNPKSHLQLVIQDLGWRVWDPMQEIFFCKVFQPSHQRAREKNSPDRRFLQQKFDP